MQVGTMLPTKKSGLVRAAAGRASSDRGMCERAALAHTAPWAISADSAVIFFRSVARVSGGSSPDCFAPARSSPTNRRISSSGLPAFTPRRSCVGPWLTPMPKRKRPPDSSCTRAAVWAKSYGCRV